MVIDRFNASTPLVSILVLTYNHATYIRSCIKSLLAVHYENAEIIVLDDGSSDDTFAIAKLFERDARIPVCVHTQPQSGGATSRNSQKLLQMAKGKYVLLLSGDDALAPDFDLKFLVQRLEEDTNIVMSFSRAIHVVMGDASQSLNVYTPEFRCLLLGGNPEQIYRDHLCSSVSRLFLQGSLIRRDFYESFGGFDADKLADDYGFVMRAFKAMIGTSKRIIFAEDCLWLYRVHPMNIHGDKKRQRQLVFEIVSEYVPKEYWPQFKWDHLEPTDFEEFDALRGQMIAYFGDVAIHELLPPMEDRFIYSALQENNLAALGKILANPTSRSRALSFFLPRSYRLLPFFKQAQRRNQVSQ